MPTYDIRTGVCVLSVAYGLRDMGAISRGEQGVTKLLDDFHLRYRSDRRYFGETYFARTEDTLDDFETAVAKLNSADFKVDRNVDAFVDSRKAREIIKSECSRKQLVRDYVQGNAFGYPRCCIENFVDFGLPIEDANEYVPWHSCSEKCAPSARFTKRIKKVLSTVGVINPKGSVKDLMSRTAKLP